LPRLGTAMDVINTVIITEAGNKKWQNISAQMG